MLKRIIIISLVIFVVAGLCFIEISATFPSGEECTIGVASGKCTTDGRPMIWKSRDASRAWNNQVYYNTSHQYKFLAVITGKGYNSAWQGVNDQGFAILNSVSSDLPGTPEGVESAGMGNGSFMRYALGTCATMADFERLLESTNSAGRRTKSNFAVLDASGEAALFETAHRVYWKYGANDINDAPQGYILRANFALNGGGKGGLHRYNRTVKLFDSFDDKGKVSYKDILRIQMRDFQDADNNPLSVPFARKLDEDSPFGYFSSKDCICRYSTVSGTVIQGVLPGEEPMLSTMWTMLGQPAAAVAVPYWPVGETPPEAYGTDSAPLCDTANMIKALLFDYEADRDYVDSYKLRNGRGSGLWEITFPAEDKIFAETENKLNEWRKNGVNVQDMLETESRLAAEALAALNMAYDELKKINDVKRK